MEINEYENKQIIMTFKEFMDMLSLETETPAEYEIDLIIPNYSEKKITINLEKKKNEN